MKQTAETQRTQRLRREKEEENANRFWFLILLLTVTGVAVGQGNHPATRKLVACDNSFDAQSFFQKLWSYDQVVFDSVEGATI